MIGAVLAGADGPALNKVEQMAKNIGISFQIQDDILDVTGSPEVLGKPIHSDEKNHKTTYVTLKGIENAQREVERLSQEAIETFDGLEEKNEFLRTLIQELVNRKK